MVVDVVEKGARVQTTLTAVCEGEGGYCSGDCERDGGGGGGVCLFHHNVSFERACVCLRTKFYRAEGII